MIDLVLIDCDGTLVGSEGVPASAWTAIDAARDAGLGLALCTGRPGSDLTRGFARRMDPEGAHVFDAGATLVKGGGELLRVAALPTDAVRAAAALADAHGHVLELYPPEGRYLVLRETSGTDAHAALLDSPAHPVTLPELAGTDIVRVQFLVAPGTTFDGARPGARAIAGCHVHEATSPLMPGYRFCSLTRADVSKLEAARWIAGRRGTTLERVAAVGDGDNDRELLAGVGFGIAMGNASEATRAAADLVVSGVDEAGLADALEAVRARRRSG